MGFLLVVQNVVIYTVVTFVLALITPLRRSKDWRVFVGLLAVGMSLGVWSARRALDAWMISHVKEYRGNPASDIPARYVLGDFIPAKKLIGGGLPDEVRDFVTATAASDDRCLRAMAQSCQGKSVDIRQECVEAPPAAPARVKTWRREIHPKAS